MLLVCWTAAFVACIAYGVASVLQSVGARSADTIDSGLGLTSVALIWVQLPYLGGLALDSLGFVANAVALQRLPLYLVQSVVSASVVVTALVARWRGAHLNRWEWSAVGVVVVGLALLSISAGTDAAGRLSMPAQWLILAVGAVPLGIGIVSLRMPGPTRALGVAVAAGLSFCGVEVAARALLVPHPWWHVLASPLLWAILVHGIIGTAMFAVALQHGSVTAVTAIAVVLQLIVPGAVGLIWLRDTVGQGMVAPAIAGFVLTVAGTVGLARYLSEPGRAR